MSTLLFDIPEVLEHILLFLDYSSRRQARFVSKRWYATSRRLFHIRAVWQENPVAQNQHSVLQYLGSLDCLRYDLKKRGDDDSPDVRVAWTRLRDHILAGKAAHLPQLELVGAVDVPRRILPLLPSLSGLKSILLAGNTFANFTIAMFLNECPQLESFWVLEKTAYTAREAQPQIVDKTAALQPGDLQGSYKLRSLRLIEICVAEESIADIVEHCPNLHTLVLYYITHPLTSTNHNTSTSNSSNTSTTQIDNAELIAHINTSCPSLHHLHVTHGPKIQKKNW